MRQIKLSGRERAVLRAIDFSTGTMGEDLLTITSIPAEDLVDVLNALMDTGYAECIPYAEHTSEAELRATRFDVNPGYALELREALKRTL